MPSFFNFMKAEVLIPCISPAHHYKLLPSNILPGHPAQFQLPPKPSFSAFLAKYNLLWHHANVFCTPGVHHRLLTSSCSPLLLSFLSALVISHPAGALAELMCALLSLHSIKSFSPLQSSSLSSCPLDCSHTVSNLWKLLFSGFLCFLLPYFPQMALTSSPSQCRVTNKFGEGVLNTCL